MFVSIGIKMMSNYLLLQQGTWQDKKALLESNYRLTCALFIITILDLDLDTRLLVITGSIGYTSYITDTVHTRVIITSVH